MFLSGYWISTYSMYGIHQYKSEKVKWSEVRLWFQDNSHQKIQTKEKERNKCIVAWFLICLWTLVVCVYKLQTTGWPTDSITWYKFNYQSTNTKHSLDIAYSGIIVREIQLGMSPQTYIYTHTDWGWSISLHIWDTVAQYRSFVSTLPPFLSILARNSWCVVFVSLRSSAALGLALPQLCLVHRAHVVSATLCRRECATARRRT